MRRKRYAPEPPSTGAQLTSIEKAEVKNTTSKKKLHNLPSDKTRWAYYMQAIEPTSEAINHAFPDYHPQWVQQSQIFNIAAANFINLRQALGLSRVQCAAYLRIGVSTLHKWENGRTPVPFIAFELLRLVLDSVKFKLSHAAWDGWYIAENGVLQSPDIGGDGFTPKSLVWSVMTRNEAALLRNEVEKLKSDLNTAIAENTALRQMFLANGILDEVAAMQQNINNLMARINTARIIPFVPTAIEQSQEKVA